MTFAFVVCTIGRLNLHLLQLFFHKSDKVFDFLKYIIDKFDFVFDPLGIFFHIVSTIFAFVGCIIDKLDLDLH